MINLAIIIGAIGGAILGANTTNIWLCPVGALMLFISGMLAHGGIKE